VAVLPRKSAESLLERMGAIAASLEPCSFGLDEPLPSEDLKVFAAWEEVSVCTDADWVEGCVYDEASAVVQLAPATCRAVGAGECPDVVFGSVDGGRRCDAAVADTSDLRSVPCGRGHTLDGHLLFGRPPHGVTGGQVPVGFGEEPAGHGHGEATAPSPSRGALVGHRGFVGSE